MKRSLIATALCALLLIPALAQADISEIKTAQLKSRLDSGESIVLVDTMPPLIYQVRHLPGAISIPASKIRQQLPGAVPDKAQTVAFYCMGRK